jgi:hypothetical protein
MYLDQTPFFRKIIIPWYDSNSACWILMICMLLVFGFALVGVSVARLDPDLAEHAWFPGMLALLAFYLKVKLAFRLRQRFKND